MGEPVISGGCLCGTIRYAISGPIADSGWCHCSLCRKASGAPAMAWVSLRPQQFAYTRGKPAVFRSSPQAVREFCPVCGTHLVFRMDDPRQWLDVTTGSLDAPEEYPPQKHVWHPDRLPWMDAGRDLPAFAGDDDLPSPEDG